MAPEHDHSNELALSATDLPTDFRLTPQRRVVYEVLLDKRDHPTATEVFMRVKNRMPSISLATVYNCLETLTHAGLVKQVNLDRAPSRYCPNLKEHAHFHCEGCGEILDVNLPVDNASEAFLQMPEGSIVHKLEVAVRGLCPKCATSGRH